MQRSKKHLGHSTRTFLFLLMASFSSFSYALPFDISLKSGTTLPTSVVAGREVYAYYTVKNNTSTVRMGNHVRYLPLNTRQITTGANLCGTSFTLNAKNISGDSCTLQLAISGIVNANDSDPHHHLFVCFPGDITCAGTNVNLNVTIATTTPSYVTLGNVQFGSNLNPLVYTSLDGLKWSNSILPLLPTGGPSVSMTSTTCSASGLACLIAGSTTIAGVLRPIVYNSNDGGNTWSTPIVLTPPTRGTTNSIAGVACDSAGVKCLTGGRTTVAGLLRPLVYTSIDGGNTWSNSILPTPPTGGTLSASTDVNCDSTGLKCSLVGYTTISSVVRPVVYNTVDGGNN